VSVIVVDVKVVSVDDVTVLLVAVVDMVQLENSPL
jgi:hypothetical protein